MYRAAGLFPIEVRRRVAEKYGPFDRKIFPNAAASPMVCASGYCAMGALARELGVHCYSEVAAMTPDPYSLAIEMERQGFLPDGLTALEAMPLIGRAAVDNDRGRLATRAAVLRFLGIKEGE